MTTCETYDEGAAVIAETRSRIERESLYELERSYRVALVRCIASRAHEAERWLQRFASAFFGGEVQRAMICAVRVNAERQNTADAITALRRHVLTSEGHAVPALDW